MLHGGPLRDFHRSKYRSFSNEQVSYLAFLKQQGFEPSVIYDIGAGMLHWVREAKRFWSDASFVLFEASDHLSFLYRDYMHHIGLIGNKSLLYQPVINARDSSIGLYDARSLDDVVSVSSFPLPDFVKIDARNGCLQIILGGIRVLSHAKFILVELQDCSLPELCPVMMEYGWDIHHIIHYKKPNHSDYMFIRRGEHIT